ncbi:MAG: glycosyl hydrolase family 28-related protein, partial [Terracidiphilus sp.]|nr:glycosyl hydrolase family 28-related protein [Terracidiphilus sp.]
MPRVLCRKRPWTPGLGFLWLGMPLIVAVIAAVPALAQGGIFNVRTFGATGNGLTDDAPAIQRAEAAAEQAGGGVVYLPAGRYLLNSAVL